MHASREFAAPLPLGKVARPFNLKAITVIMMAQTAVARLD